MRRLLDCLAAIGVAALAACTTLPGGAKVEGYSGAERPLFRGVAYPLPQDQGLPTPVRYIFHIHGMGLTDRDGFHADLYSLLAEKYPVREPNPRWYPARLPTPVTVKGEGLDCGPWTDHLDRDGKLGGRIEKPCYFDSFGSFRVDVFHDRARREEVRLYTYFWHRDLWRIQEPHLRKDMERNHGPALINTYLKREVMDGGLSDAAAYAGPAGALVRAGIGSVLCTMARDAAGLGFDPGTARSLRDCGGDLSTGPDVEFSYVTHSLGSRMLFDVLAPPDDEPVRAEAPRATARGFLLERGRTVFMAANQVPLLAVARIELSGDPAADPLKSARVAGPAPSSNSLRRMLEAKRVLSGVPTPGLAPAADALQVVAFQDPDDILGFRVSDAYKGDVEFVDVTHRNIGQVLWLFTWPPGAHDREVSKSVLQKLMGTKTRQMVLCGAHVDTRGRVRPYECRPPV
jgi:hypothetical protein